MRQGHLWSSTGTLLATVTMTSSPGASGWQIAALATPVPVQANTTYVVSYHTDNNYFVQAGFFNNPYSEPFGLLSSPESPFDNGSGTDGNGLYAYSPNTIFPTLTYRNENYWVDATFAPASSTTLIDTNAAANATNENAAPGTPVGITATDSVVGVTYSLSNSAGGRFTINPSTGDVTVAGAIDRETAGASLAIEVTATSSSGTHLATFNIAIGDVDEFAVTAPVDDDFTANGVAVGTATGTPVGITALARDADATTNAVTYSLSDNAGGRFAIGATTGIVTVGNGALIDTVTTHQIAVRATSADGSTASQTFSIPVTAQPTTISLFNPQAPVTGTLSNDNASVELGVKFQSSQTGTITALRYYRASGDAGDTDVRQGHLWSSTGTLLATVTMTSSPGASGWQVGALMNPVPITPSTTYIASYHTENNYLEQINFFTTTFTSGVLTAPSTATAGGNGVYAYGGSSTTGIFPTNTFSAANYYADVVFTASATNPPLATNLSAAESYTEDTPLNLTDIVVSDADSANVTVTLTLSNPGGGQPEHGTSGGVTSTYIAGTGVWTASGAIADVNALLAG